MQQLDFMPSDLDTWRNASIKERWNMIQEDLDSTKLKSQGQKQRIEAINKVFDMIDNMPKQDQPPSTLINLWLACKGGDGPAIDKNLDTLKKLSQARNQVSEFIPSTPRTSTTQNRTQFPAGRNTNLRSR